MSFVADLRTLLQGRDFQRLYGTRLASQFSDGLFQAAVGGYAFFSPERQATAVAIAAGLAVLLLPYSFLGPFVGVFIDRWSRRQILVISPLLRGTLLLILAALVLSHAPDWLFYGTALAVLGVNRFFLAALGASLPHVVPPHRLMAANAITPTSGTVATFLGAVAGFLLRFVAGPDAAGTAALLALSGLTYGASAAIARTMERSLLGPAYDPALPQAREALRNVLRGLADGARHVARRRGAAGALGAMASHRLLYGILIAETYILYRYHFTDDADAALGGIAVVVATSGAGYFLAVVVTPWATRRFPIETWIPLTLAACGVLAFGLCVTFHEWGFAAAGFALGLGGQSVKICTDTVVQRDVEDAYLGRVFSIYDMLFNGMTVAGAAIAAALLPADGRSVTTLAVASAGYLLSAAAYRLLVPRADRPPVLATEAVLPQRQPPS